MVDIRSLGNLKSNLFRVERLTCLQVIPDRGLKNSSVSSIGKSVAEFYKRFIDRVSIKDKRIVSTDRFIFRWVMSKDEVTFYFLVPERLGDHFKQKLQSVWEKATIINVPDSFSLKVERCVGAELKYRRHEIFSLNTDTSINAPMNGILATLGEMKEDDKAVINVIFEPVSRLDWEYQSNKAYEAYQKGKMPRKTGINKEFVKSFILDKTGDSFNSFQGSVIEMMGGEKKKRDSISFIDPEREILALSGLSNATTSKLHLPVLRTGVSIIAESKNCERARLIVRSIANSYKDISGDNELVMCNLGKRWIVNNVLDNKISTSMLFSPGEVGKMIQLPTVTLQEEYKQIKNIRDREVSIPEELTYDVPGVLLGEVTERGITKKVKVPVVEIPGVQLKHVYDALCTPTMGSGQMGTGKTDGLGGNWVHGFLLNGFSAFVIDTADGQILRNLEDSLPKDYPDKKIIHLELDNKHYPIALNWSDTASRNLLGAEDELEAIEMGERLTARLIDYVDGNATTELSDRMRQYLTSVARITLSDPRKCLFDTELALRSPVYREELLRSPLLDEMPEVKQDLLSLQEKAKRGTEATIIDPIISRLKMFTESKALQNLFYQNNKLRGNKPLLDFRHYADNPEGGYGYLVAIHASSDAWGQQGQELILSFIQDKILMSIYSRVDIPQDKRKPCLNLIDEPHRFIKKAARLYVNASVELRKYRLKLLWLAHYMSQMGSAAEAVAAGGCQFTSYKTQSLKQFMELGHVFEPFDANELYRTLPEKWTAVNKVRLPSGKDCPAFIAKMAPPPAFVRSREERREQCAKEFGSYWKNVGMKIQEKRLHYQRLDEEWRENQE